jgi:Histidine kinase-, DNA gyrase B-, and HSP90-like ATPase
MTEQSLINNPDADRLIHGLRDTGYNFNTAAADIIDNSIAANAQRVDVLFDMDTHGRKVVTFADDGHGMNADQLHSAMRYGAPVRDNLASLGKFGLGLKTASSSVCRRYTVLSKRSDGQDISKLAWDLDHVAEVNQWEMLREPITEEEQERFEELIGEHGTMVVWSKCDRVLDKEYAQPGGTHEMNALKRKAERLGKHCALVYYRFLDSTDNRERDVEITVDGKRVLPWNPFYLEKSEQVLSEKHQVIPLQLETGEIYNAKMKAYILPRAKELSKEEQAVARITNHGQGFYIHREGRVIHNGGWLGVFGGVEPHTSLLRVEFDFDHNLDDAFKVDVKKSRILFDPALEDLLREILQPIYREANNRYRNKTRQDIAGGGVDHSASNTNIDNTPGRKEPKGGDYNPETGEATIHNRQGTVILHNVEKASVDPGSVYIQPVEFLPSGDLYEPAMHAVDNGDVLRTGVRINKSHDFYAKIYMRAQDNGYSIEGMDYLLWALAAAEMDNTNKDLEPMFQEIREEVSANLKKLLRALPLPDEEDLNAGK